jgi:hypothetical protein
MQIPVISDTFWGDIPLFMSAIALKTLSFLEILSISFDLPKNISEGLAESSTKILPLNLKLTFGRMPDVILTIRSHCAPRKYFLLLFGFKKGRLFIPITYLPPQSRNIFQLSRKNFPKSECKIPRNYHPPGIIEILNLGLPLAKNIIQSHHNTNFISLDSVINVTK